MSSDTDNIIFSLDRDGCVVNHLRNIRPEHYQLILDALELFMRTCTEKQLFEYMVADRAITRMKLKVLSDRIDIERPPGGAAAK